MFLVVLVVVFFYESVDETNGDGSPLTRVLTPRTSRGEINGREMSLIECEHNYRLSYSKTSRTFPPHSSNGLLLWKRRARSRSRRLFKSDACHYLIFHLKFLIILGLQMDNNYCPAAYKGLRRITTPRGFFALRKINKSSRLVII